MAQVKKKLDEPTRDPIIVWIWKSRDRFGTAPGPVDAQKMMTTNLALESYRDRVRRFMPC